MKERLKQIRKACQLSQTEFGKKLGVSRDVISNYEMGRVEPTELFINHLCTTFNINRCWLQNGIGEMFDDDDKNIIEYLVGQYGLNVREAFVIKSFLQLSPAGRNSVIEFAERITENIKSFDNRNDLISSDIATTEKIAEKIDVNMIRQTKVTE